MTYFICLDSTKVALFAIIDRQYKNYFEFLVISKIIFPTKEISLFLRFTVWIFNYLLFELFKILSDGYDESHHHTLKFMYHEHNYSISWMMYVVMLIILILIQVVDLPTLFHLDAYLMFGFMVLRSLKQIYKKRL